MGDVDRVRATFSLSFGLPHPQILEKQEKHGSGHPHHEQPHDVLELHDVTIEPEISPNLPEDPNLEEGHLDLSA